MERIARLIDKLARQYSLNWAIFYTVFATYFLCWDVFYFIGKEAKSGNHFWLDAAIVGLILAVLGIPTGILMIHAVVRRLIAESRSTT